MFRVVARDRLLDALAQDLADRMLADAELRREIAEAHFSGLNDDDLVQCVYDAGLQEQDDVLMEAVEKLER